METKQTPFKQAVINLPFHSFDEEPEFLGIYKSSIMVGEEEPFKVNIFVNIKTGEEVFIANSYSIDKSIQLAKSEFSSGISDLVFNILFIGKTVVKGKPFNQFNIGYCTLEDYEKYNKSLEVPEPKKK